MQEGQEAFKAHEIHLLNRMIGDLTSRNIPVSPETILSTLSSLGWKVKEEERADKLEAIQQGIEHIAREKIRIEEETRQEEARIAEFKASMNRF